jgi:transcriptional regulator with XRE-family HTH domain
MPPTCASPPPPRKAPIPTPDPLTLSVLARHPSHKSAKKNRTQRSPVRLCANNPPFVYIHNVKYNLQKCLVSGIIFYIMAKHSLIPLPALQRRMEGVGDNLRLARLRRNLSATQVAERAGITRQTLGAIERGAPSVSFGAYATVLFCLGMEQDLEALGRDDELGRKLQDAGLTIKRRAPRRPQTVAKPPTPETP